MAHYTILVHRKANGRHSLDLVQADAIAHVMCLIERGDHEGAAER